MYDGVSRKSCSFWIGSPAAEAGDALYWHTAGVGVLGCTGYDNWKRALQFISPLYGDGVTALNLDGWARNCSIISPNTRQTQIAVELVFRKPHRNNETTFLLLCNDAAGNG